MDFYGGYSMHDLFDGPDFIAGFIGVILIIGLIASAANLVFYILRSIGLYRLAVNRGMSGAGLAWIPFVGSYRIGSIADDISAREGSQSYFRHFLLAGNIVSVLPSFTNMFSSFSALMDGIQPYGYWSTFPRMILMTGALSSLSYLISFASYVITIVALNKIYKCYRPVSSTTWTVLSVLPFMQSIFPFVIRNDVPAPLQAQPWGASPQGMPPQGGYYPPPDGQWPPPPPNGGYAPPPYQGQPGKPGGYYPPRAPEPPPYYPPAQSPPPEQAPPHPPPMQGCPPEQAPPYPPPMQGSPPEQAPPPPPVENDDPSENN